MKLRRTVLVVFLLAGGLLTVPNPVNADVVDGNPVFTDHHQVSLNRYVNLIYSKPNPCSAHYGPSCAGLSSTVQVYSPQFGGDPNTEAQIAVCNLRVVTPPVGGGAEDGQGDYKTGCDWGNTQGRAGVYGSFEYNPIPATLDSLGNCCQQGALAVLQLPSSATLTTFQNDGCCSAVTGTNANPEAVCPPTPGQIAAGWTCVVEVSDPIGGDRNHGGYRHVHFKSPIPAMSCGGHTCLQFIPTGTQVTVSGVQFPCRIRQLDDTVGTPSVYDGACIGKWVNKTILIKRVSTQTIVASITPTSQTSGFDGSYSITFTMPSVPAAGEQYKVIAHSPSCSLPCDSGKFNAAGKLFVHQ